MATLVRNVATRSADLPGAGRSDSVRAVDAVSRLANADLAEVVVYDRLCETLNSVVASSDGALVLASHALVEAAQAQTGLMFGDSRPRWFTDEEQEAETLLMIKLVDRGSRTFFIVLAFANPSEMSRTRAMKLAPDLATLIRFHVDVEIRLRELDDYSAAATAALNHGECGVIAIRHDRSVIFHNEAAANYLHEEVGLQIRRGKIVAPETKVFEAALHQTLDMSVRGPVKRSTATVMLLKRKGGARPTVIVIAPIWSSSAVPDTTKASALVYILNPTRGAQRGLEALCHLHGLSNVESRLLINLTGGLTLGDAASDMHIKLETARTYLKQIFAKTDTHRQTDLVTIMTRYLNALRGDFDFQSVTDRG